MLAFIWSKIAERETEGRAGRRWDESYHAWNNSSLCAAFLARILARRRISTQTFFLTNIAHFQVLYVMFVEYGQNVKKANTVSHR